VIARKHNKAEPFSVKVAKAREIAIAVRVTGSIRPAI
jgi:hypothetical protein